MGYLITSDFKKLIQSENLSQIIGNDNSILTGMSLTAVAEAISYLTQKYITSQEFQDINPWNPAATYVPTNRVYLDAPAYSNTATYAIGGLTLQNGQVYQCNTTISDPEAFTPGHWTLLGAQYDIFYVAYPSPLFKLTGSYRVGDLVFYGTNSWQCVIATIADTHFGDLQSVFSQNIPPGNVFPTALGQTQWKTTGPVPYIVPANTPISSTTYWIKGDNRNQQLVNYVIDIALYHLHSRIAPKNIPDLRVKRYDDAIKWLRMAGEGKITADLPLIQPKSGSRIRWGGNVRNYTTF